MQLPGGGGPQAEINITPLVDVVLVLLIIFMVVTPLDERWLEVQVPDKASDTGAPLNAPPIVAIETARVTVDGQVAEPGQLLAALQQRFARWRGTEKKVVLFQASGSVPYGQVVAAMDEAKQAGAQTLGWLSATGPESLGSMH